MANICRNEFYAYSEYPENLEKILEFMNEHYPYYDVDMGNESLDIMFESKWNFPIGLMVKLYKSIPNKNDIYMRCLSVEYGLDYVAYFKCDSDGWVQIV